MLVAAYRELMNNIRAGGGDQCGLLLFDNRAIRFSTAVSW
jgi:hypothetical protein